MLAHPLVYQFYLYGLLICGFFTLLLGLVHFFFPLLLDFRAAIPNEGALLRPFNWDPFVMLPNARMSTVLHGS
jgi:hypothetical protein